MKKKLLRVWCYLFFALISAVQLLKTPIYTTMEDLDDDFEDDDNINDDEDFGNDFEDEYDLDEANEFVDDSIMDFEDDEEEEEDFDDDKFD